METATERPPKEINLTAENYEEIRENEDGSVTLVLSDKAADFLYREGFTRE